MAASSASRSPTSPTPPASRSRRSRRSSTGARTSPPRPASASSGCCTSTATSAPPPKPTRSLLDVVFNELESPWAMEIIKGVEEVARENDLGVVLSAQEGPGALGRSWVDAVASRRRAGLILVVSELSAEQIARLTARSIPFVVVDPAGEPAPGVPSVGATNWNGGLSRHAPPARARPHPHRHDRRPAGHALQPRARGRLPRRAGDRRADRRPRADPLGHVPRRGAASSRARAARPADPPTAIFAGSDLQAFGVYEAARVNGARDPHANSASSASTTCRWPAGSGHR